MEELSPSKGLLSAFRLGGGLDMLVSSFLNGGADWRLPSALRALTAMVQYSEENKVYVLERVAQGNYPAFARRYASTSRGAAVPDVEAFRCLLELMCIGPVHQVLLAGEPEPEQAEPLPGGDGPPPALHFAESNMEEMFSDGGYSEYATDEDEFHEFDEEDSEGGSRGSRGSRGSAGGGGGGGGGESGGGGGAGEEQVGCWRSEAREVIERIAHTRFLYPNGPPPLSRHYKFLTALRKAAFHPKPTAEDESGGSSSPRTSSRDDKDSGSGSARGSGGSFPTPTADSGSGGAGGGWGAGAAERGSGGGSGRLERPVQPPNPLFRVSVSAAHTLNING